MQKARAILYAVAAAVTVWTVVSVINFHAVQKHCFDYGPCDDGRTVWHPIAGGIFFVLLLLYVAATLHKRRGSDAPWP